MTISPTLYKIMDAAELLSCSPSSLLHNHELVLLLLVPQSHHIKVEYSPSVLKALSSLNLYGIDVVNIQYLQLIPEQLDNIDMYDQHLDIADKYCVGFYKDITGSFIKVATVESIFQTHPVYNNPELMAAIQPFKDELIRLRIEQRIPRQDDGLYHPSGSGLTIRIDDIYIPNQQIEGLRANSSSLIERRAHAIVNYIKQERTDLELMNIRLGAKNEIYEALRRPPSELRFTESTFNKAWRYASSHDMLAISGGDRFTNS